MKKLIFVYVALFLSTQLLYPGTGIDPGIAETPESEEILLFPLNTAGSFKDVIPQKTFIFMVGNDHYSPDSGFSDLKYCGNDIFLLKQIFIQCCKVDPGNIYTFINVTKRELEKQYAGFLKEIGKESLVILFFSGHGVRDGSLVFTGGEKLNPREIRHMINEFSNDTVLMIDACYSGENEGFNSHDGNTLPVFKKNSIRIYSSLAHQPSKEFEYADNPYFRQTRTFFRDVLNIGESTGNGYFTALIGSFFAHTDFSANSNVSFFSLVSSMSGKGKDHLEYMEKARGISDIEYALRTELRKEHQMPKIKPMDTELIFNNPDHVNLLLKKPLRYYRPEKNFISLVLNPSLCLPLESGRLKNAFLPLVSMNYNFNFKQAGILGVGVLSGFQGLENTDETGTDYQIFPLAFNIKYFTNFRTPFFLMADFNIGAAFFIQLPAPGDNTTNTSLHTGLYIAPGIGIGINPFKELGIMISCYFNYSADIISFLPGIHLIWNF